MVFLTAATCVWSQRRPFSDIQEADTFGTMEFVGGSRKHIYTKIVHIYFDMSNRLNSIGMKHCANGMSNGS